MPEDGAAPVPRDYVFGWKVDGKFKGLATKGEGKVGGMLALQDAKQPFPVQADVAIGGTSTTRARPPTIPIAIFLVRVMAIILGVVAGFRPPALCYR